MGIMGQEGDRLMALFEYKCPECENRVISHVRGDRLDADCPHCEEPREFRRVFSVSMQRPMQEHFNHTVGQPISDPKQFARALSRKGEEYTERTGIETNYQPIDLQDRSALGVTDAGLDATRKRMHTEGRPTSL